MSADVSELERRAAERNFFEGSALEEQARRQNAEWGEEQDAQVDFTGGEISAEAASRIDHPLYRKSLKRSENMLPVKQGATRNRSGLEYVYPGTRIANSAGASLYGARMLPFIVSEDEAYNLLVDQDVDLDNRYGGGVYATPFYKGGGEVSFYGGPNLRPVSGQVMSGDYAITAITLGNPTTITVATSIDLFDLHDVYIDGITTGPTELNGRWFSALNILSDATTVDDINTQQDENTVIFHPAGPTYNSLDYLTFYPITGRTWQDVPTQWRQLLSGIYFAFTPIAANSFGLLRGAQPFGGETEIDSRLWENIGASLPSYLGFAKINRTQFTIDVDTTSSTAWSVGGTVNKALHVPLPVACTPNQLEKAHVAQGVDSIIVTGQAFRPFEIKKSIVAISDDAEPYPMYGQTYETEALSRETFGTGLERQTDWYMRAPRNLTISAVAPTGLFRYIYRVSAETTNLEQGESLSSEIDVRVNAVISGVNTITPSWDASNSAKVLTYNVYRYDPETAQFLKIGSVANPGTGTVSFVDNTINPWTGGTTELYDQSPSQRFPVFDNPNDWPASCAYSDQRLGFCGSQNDPDAIWRSEVGRYTEITKIEPTLDIIDDGSAILNRASAGRLLKMRSLAVLQELLGFGDSAEISLGAGDGQAVTPATAGPRTQSRYGSGTLQPITLDDTVIFQQTKGNVLRDFRYNADGLAGSAYGGREITILAEHLFENKTIKSWAYADEPDSALFIVFTDGTGVVLNYSREHQIVSYSKLITQGTLQDVVVVPEGTENGIYFLTQRLDAWAFGQPFALERFAARNDLDPEEGFFVDSGHRFEQPLVSISSGLILSGSDAQCTLNGGHGLVTGDIIDIRGVYSWDATKRRLVIDNQVNGQYEAGISGNTLTLRDPDTSANIDASSWNFPHYSESGFSTLWELRKTTTQVTGMTELASQTVWALANGKLEEITLDSSGDGTIPFPFSKAIVGLAYSSLIETLPAMPTSSNRHPVQYPRRPGTLAYRLVRSAGMQFGQSESSLTPRKERTSESWYDPVEFFTGYDIHLLGDEFDEEGTIVVKQDVPRPLTVAGLFPGVMHSDL